MEADFGMYDLRTALLRIYNHFRHTFSKLCREGWRPYYCWIGASVNLLALKAAFYDLPMGGSYLPDYYLIALLSFTTLMGGFMGLRSFDKHLERSNTFGGSLVNPVAVS